MTAPLHKAPAIGHLLAASAVSFGDLVGAMTSAEASMARYHWKNRPLIVFAPSGTDGRLGSQQGIVTRHRNGLRERDMVVIMVAGDHVSSQLGPEPGARAGALRARFGVKASAFRALLIGKDGGVKISSRSPLSADRLFQTIDAMPMRRGEMRRRSGR